MYIMYIYIYIYIYNIYIYIYIYILFLMLISILQLYATLQNYLYITQDQHNYNYRLQSKRLSINSVFFYLLEIFRNFPSDLPESRNTTTLYKRNFGSIMGSSGAFITRSQGCSINYADV